jgi:phosphoserine phosphatase
MRLRLAIFDLDGTLKQVRDPYAYLHEKLGTWQAAEFITARGLAGELG